MTPSFHKTCILRNSERHESTRETAFWNVCFGTVLCERTCINNRVHISWNASDTRYLGCATNGPHSVFWHSAFLTVFCLWVANSDFDIYTPVPRDDTTPFLILWLSFGCSTVGLVSNSAVTHLGPAHSVRHLLGQYSVVPVKVIPLWSEA